MINELNFRELEQIPHIMVKLIEGQVLEEFMLEEEICNSSLPDLPKFYKAEDGVCTNKTELEMPEINAVEISALPREIKLEKLTEQGKSKSHTNGRRF